MKKYKLTNQEMQTRGGFKLEIEKKVIISREGNKLCSDQVIHYYDHPALAILFNPVHANITNPRLFECEVWNVVAHDGLKGGCKELTLLKEIEIPAISKPQKIDFVLMCAKKASTCKSRSAFDENWFNIIAGVDWLNITNKSAASAASEVAYAVLAEWGGSEASYAASMSKYFIETIEGILKEEAK